MALSWATIVREIVAATNQATTGQAMTGYPIRTAVEAIAKASRRAAAHTRKRMITEGFLTSLSQRSILSGPVRAPREQGVLGLHDDIPAYTAFEMN